MIRTELKICMSADFAAGSAWLIPGEHAPRWIDEICKWEIDQDTATIVALPTNAHDRRPLGALVICSPQREHSFGVSPTALPFRRIGENLFVPANAQLSPLAELHEIEDIFHRQNIYVWHPNVGLVVAGPEEQLTIPDLFQTPEVSDWLMNAGCAGTNWPSRLISIELEDELMQSLESMMQTQRDGIGERSNEIDQLEPLPEEGSLNRTVESLKQSIARMIGWVCSEDAPQDSNQLKDTAKNSVDINREPNALQRLIDSIVYSMGSALPNGLLDRIEGIKNWADNQLNDARMPRGLAGARPADCWVVERLTSISRDWTEIPPAAGTCLMTCTLNSTKNTESWPGVKFNWGVFDAPLTSMATCYPTINRRQTR